MVPSFSLEAYYERPYNVFFNSPFKEARYQATPLWRERVVLIASREQKEQGGTPFCSDNPFANIRSLGHCTGFLWNDHLLVTAGHCVRHPDSFCKEFIFLRHYYADLAQGPHDILECKKVVSRVLDVKTGLDLAIISLKRAFPLSEVVVDGNDKEVKQKVGVLLHHPFGGPLEISSMAALSPMPKNPFYYSAPINGFEGSSGAPVFHPHTGHLQGMMIRGKKDLIWDEEHLCYHLLPREEEGDDERLLKAFFIKDRVDSLK